MSSETGKHPRLWAAAALPATTFPPLSALQRAWAEPGSTGAAVKSRTGCVDASLETQKLEVMGLGMCPAQPPQG